MTTRTRKTRDDNATLKAVDPEPATAPEQTSPEVTAEKAKRVKPTISLTTLDESTGIKRTSSTTDEELEAVKNAVRQSQERGVALAYRDQASEEAGKAIVNLLQRARQALAAEGLVLSLEKSVTQNGDGLWDVDFQAKISTRKRNYTSKDIREWASSTKWGTIEGKIPVAARDQFKSALADAGDVEKLLVKVADRKRLVEEEFDGNWSLYFDSLDAGTEQTA